MRKIFGSEKDLTETVMTSSGAPYISCGTSIKTMNLDLIIALLPSCLWSSYLFGARVPMILLIGIISSIIFDTLAAILLGKRLGAPELSPIANGLVISALLPPGAPLWLPVVTALFTVLADRLLKNKEGFGINPAIAAYSLAAVLFRDAMTSFTEPFTRLPALDISQIRLGAVTDAVHAPADMLRRELPLSDIFFGANHGYIGTVSVFLLLLGGVYLILRKSASAYTAAGFLASAAAASFLMHGGSDITDITQLQLIGYELLDGTFIFCALFAAAEPTSSPLTQSGKLIYGLGGGALGAILRHVDLYPCAAPFALLLVELFVPIIDKYTIPKPFGELNRDKKAETKSSGDGKGTSRGSRVKRAKEGERTASSPQTPVSEREIRAPEAPTSTADPSEDAKLGVEKSSARGDDASDTTKDGAHDSDVEKSDRADNA